VDERRNFDLKVGGNQVAGYQVEAIGPGGERASGPFDPARLGDLMSDLRLIRSMAADRAVLEDVGSRLFAALFPRDVLRVYDRVRPGPGEREELRLRLHLPPELALWPWELLYDQSHYLSFDSHCPIIRFLDLPDTPSSLSTEPPLRLLHLVASPVGVERLDVEKEAALLDIAMAASKEQGLVEIIPGRPGTLETLRRGLQQGCHVLHFSGHGGFAADEGFLLFEDETGAPEKVDRDTLAHLLRGSQVRLAVLNACESALATDNDAFTSVAAALVRAGLPAVIAHQYAMPDVSAIRFAAEFYRALADGLPVDAAVCEGRKAILSELGPERWERVDWAAPVLFMRNSDGQILTLHGKNGDSADQSPLVTQVTTTVNVESINGGVVNIGAIGGPVAGGIEAGPIGVCRGEEGPFYSQPIVPRPGERLPVLLAELGQKVRTLAPREQQPQAREQVASLERALAGEQLDAVGLAEAWGWFETELPSLSGAALSIIREAEPLAEREGEAALDEFHMLFGKF
jgi:hypothetical protein